MLEKKVLTFCSNFIVIVNNYFELGVGSCMFHAELYTFHLHYNFVMDLLYISECFTFFRRAISFPCCF